MGALVQIGYPGFTFYDGTPPQLPEDTCLLVIEANTADAPFMFIYTPLLSLTTIIFQVNFL